MSDREKMHECVKKIFKDTLGYAHDEYSNGADFEDTVDFINALRDHFESPNNSYLWSSYMLKNFSDVYSAANHLYSDGIRAPE